MKNLTKLLGKIVGGTLLTAFLTFNAYGQHKDNPKDTTIYAIPLSVSNAPCSFHPGWFSTLTKSYSTYASKDI